VAVKDPEVAAALERARQTYKTFQVGEARLKFGRLTLEDNIAIKDETGFDLFGESLAKQEVSELSTLMPLNDILRIIVWALTGTEPPPLEETEGKGT